MYELMQAASDADVAIPTALRLELSVLLSMAWALLLGRITSPELGKVVIPELVGNMTEHAGQVFSRAGDRALRENVNHARIAAVHLGQASRVLAWMASAAYLSALRDRGDLTSLRSAFIGAQQARQGILVAVDPDPPGHYVPATHPWSHGLSDSESAVLWWWAFCDLNGSRDGPAFYAMHEILTGEKFYGSFGWGDRYLLTEAEDRLAPGGRTDHHAPCERSHKLFERLGGFRLATLDLFATSLATWRDRRVAIPEGFEENWTHWHEPLRVARRARLFLFPRNAPISPPPRRPWTA
ncbi:MAG: hypothetical protein DLM61_16435 [Pseudonocardiales bacterium]|nr:MAG: hypothetical protein DLM61_16435 [Pseudonocardiales bacterium]